MNYEDMSDFEVNGAVAAIVTGGDVIEKNDMAEAPTDDGVQVIYKVGVHGEFLDYCNNPSDAWPIIFENRICIKPHPFSDESWNAVKSSDTSIICITSPRPLRAAMICFLKMKDAEK